MSQKNEEPPKSKTNAQVTVNVENPGLENVQSSNNVQIQNSHTNAQPPIKVESSDSQTKAPPLGNVEAPNEPNKKPVQPDDMEAYIRGTASYGPPLPSTISFHIRIESHYSCGCVYVLRSIPSYTKPLGTNRFPPVKYIDFTPELRDSDSRFMDFASNSMRKVVPRGNISPGSRSYSEEGALHKIQRIHMWCSRCETMSRPTYPFYNKLTNTTTEDTKDRIYRRPVVRKTLEYGCGCIRVLRECDYMTLYPGKYTDKVPPEHIKRFTLNPKVPRNVSIEEHNSRFLTRGTYSDAEFAYQNTEIFSYKNPKGPKTMCRHCSAKPKKQVPQTAQPASMSVDRAENDGLHEGNANGEHNRGNENNSVDGNNSVTRRFCPSSLCNVL